MIKYLHVDLFVLTNQPALTHVPTDYIHTHQCIYTHICSSHCYCSYCTSVIYGKYPLVEFVSQYTILASVDVIVQLLLEIIWEWFHS